MGEDTVSGWMFAGDFVRISKTLEGLQQKQCEGTIIIYYRVEYTRKTKVTANVKKVGGSCM